MATAPNARLKTVRYSGGTVRATRGALNKLLGTLQPSWDNLRANGGGGPRRPFGYRRMSNAAAGVPLRVEFTDGEVWTYRVTGPYKRFISQVLARGAGASVEEIRSPRGAEFARELSLN
jgi:hypothetical protein